MALIQRGFKSKYARRTREENSCSWAYGGRALIPIDWTYVEKSLQACCSGVSIARTLGIHEDTLYRRVEEKYGMPYVAFVASMREKGDDMLRNAQMEKALEKDNTMLIWLGKNRLKQRDQFHDITISKDQKEAIDKLLAALAPPPPPIIDHAPLKESNEESS